MKTSSSWSAARMSKVLALKSIDCFLDSLGLYCSEKLMDDDLAAVGNRYDDDDDNSKNNKELFFPYYHEAPLPVTQPPDERMFTVMLRVLMFHARYAMGPPSLMMNATSIYSVRSSRKVHEACNRFSAAAQCESMPDYGCVVDENMRNHITRRAALCIEAGWNLGNVTPQKLRIVKRVISGFELETLNMGLGWSSSIVQPYKKKAMRTKMAEKEGLERPSIIRRRNYDRARSESPANSTAALRSNGGAPLLARSRRSKSVEWSDISGGGAGEKFLQLPPIITTTSSPPSTPPRRFRSSRPSSPSNTTTATTTPNPQNTATILQVSNLPEKDSGGGDDLEDDDVNKRNNNKGDDCLIDEEYSIRMKSKEERRAEFQRARQLFNIK